MNLVTNSTPNLTSNFAPNFALSEVDDKQLVWCLTDAMQAASQQQTAHVICNAMRIDVSCFALGFYVRISGPDWQLIGTIAHAATIHQESAYA
jgi:hypothetical protein